MDLPPYISERLQRESKGPSSSTLGPNLPEFLVLIPDPELAMGKGGPILQRARSLDLHDFEKQQLQYLLEGGQLVLRALHGAERIQNPIGPLLDFLTNHRLGLHLLAAAHTAHRAKQVDGVTGSPRNPWAAFSASLWCHGFVTAWQASHRIIEYPSDLPPDQEALWHRKYTRSMDPTTYEWRQGYLHDLIPRCGTDGFEDFVTQWSKIQLAETKRAKRGAVPREESEYRELIRKHWLWDALWCRTTQEIESRYYPDSGENSHPYNLRMIDKAISGLDFAASRCQANGPKIRRAEESETCQE